MALQHNEPVFLSTEDEQKYRQLQANFKSACERIQNLSEFILKLKETQWECAPKLSVSKNAPDFMEIIQVPKTDWELLNKWKNLIEDFNL